MKPIEIKTESAPGSLTNKSVWGFPVVETDMSMPLNLEIKFEDMSRYIQKLITIEADVRDVEKYHRGWKGTITVYDRPVTDDEARSETYNVVCKSRYKLRNRKFRMKFLTVE